jgi:hypothetical protein
MKRHYLLISLLALLTACSDNGQPAIEDLSMGDATILLSGTNGQGDGFDVQLRNTQTNSLFTQKTNAEGKATFHVTPGIYEATATKKQLAGNTYYIYNGALGQITVRNGVSTSVTMEMKQAKTSQIVIKELYNGGCMKDDGVTYFQYDKCFILYNNSAEPASLANLCIGFCAPSNAQAANHNYTADGQLTYEAEGFIPVWNGVWYFPNTLTIAPYSQVVVNICGAIDNTQTVSASINYAHSEYYCMYDPESGYYNTNYYPTPSAVIPTSHYLKAVIMGLGNGWPLSTSSPAFVLFQIPESTNPREYCTNPDNIWYSGGDAKQVNACAKVPNAWIVDAMEVYAAAYKDGCMKRLTSDVDAGYAWLTHQHGHTLYRNVDQEATEALEENTGKLVYNYQMGVAGSTDPSGIDAEASLRNGAHIIYQDTNNSTNDFHERLSCSIKD